MINEDSYLVEFIIGIACTALGSIATLAVTQWSNRKQKMKCYYYEEDILSKLPVVDEDKTICNGIQVKKFKLVNTTNKDFASIIIAFQFHDNSIIRKAQHSFKRKQNHFKCEVDKSCAQFTIRNFNRKDLIYIEFELGNVDFEECNVVVIDGLGFEVVVCDRRKRKKLSKINLNLSSE